MNPKEKRYDVGVVIGRFQVHELHEAHKDLIESVIKRHDRVIIFLGLSELRNTKNNPLDFNARKQMIQEDYPDIEIHYVNDMPSDEDWSRNLDLQIKRWINPDHTAVLYGSRDSFISHYHGKYDTCELEPEVFISGTVMRKKISSKTMNSKEFRAGAIWAAHQRYDTSYTTVDIAILDDKNRILLGKKNSDSGIYRFVGGFTDVNSKTLEADAIRETREETGLEISHPEYVCSLQVGDWRYRSETDKVKTTLWMVHHVFGSPKAGDDLDGLKWFDLDDPELFEKLIKPHQKLLNKLLESGPYARYVNDLRK